ncbi:helix-turn-helix domain-containing protein [Sporomusa termitida]|uniref:HTH-type transcriptional regulator SutR n=1 Tax=Sporomusa termitida TaxID=2377 RepID=A0A517DUE0_9FIRM|nr:XRE family transcriptional regulator [Sporomusa termitida]QDR80961.1 HTH-type transcriptional regulator SutR [Sporomusa termitida]
MSFGKNVKLARIEKKLSLQELASLSGVSVSMLSKIERGEKTPTIRVAAQIAQGLRLSISYLLNDDFHASVSIVKKNQRKVLYDPVSKIESLIVSPANDVSALKIFQVSLPKSASTGTLPPLNAGGRIYLIVAKGKITVLLDSGIYDLAEGDCILFDANVTHEILNSGDDEAQYFSINDRYGLKLIPPAEFE